LPVKRNKWSAIREEKGKFLCNQAERTRQGQSGEKRKRVRLITGSSHGPGAGS